MAEARLQQGLQLLSRGPARRLASAHGTAQAAYPTGIRRPGAGGGWKAYLQGNRLGSGATSCRLSSKTSLKSGAAPSTQAVPANGSPHKLAAKALWAVTARKPDHLERKALAVPARSPSGAALARALASNLKKVAASSLHRPPTSAARTINLQRRPLTSSG